MKIRPELEVPDGKYCGTCTHRVNDECRMFGEWLIWMSSIGGPDFRKLHKRVDAEVKE